MHIVSKIGGKSFKFKLHSDLTNEQLFYFDLGERKIQVELIEVKQDSVTVSIDNRVRFFEIHREKGRIKEIATSANVFPVEVMTPQQEELEQVLEKYKSKEAHSVKLEIQSPMPGKILEILVQPGERVELGQVVAILEAMKMENEIASTVDGNVKEIKVTKGDTVALDQVLITFE